MHVTLRAHREAGFLRTERVFGELRRAIASANYAGALAAASSRTRTRTRSCVRLRVVHFSVQSNHLHLIVEASEGEELATGISGLVIRLARAINRAVGRRGAVWGDRYYRHDLKTPNEVRQAIVYVIANIKKHARRHIDPKMIDPLSSARWLDGWRPPVPVFPDDEEPIPIAAPRTWLLATGWRRHGLIRPEDSPRAGAGTG